MRILHINTVCDFGSTGRFAREVADFLEKQGHECYVAYGYKRTNYHRSFMVGGMLENLFHNAFYTRLLGLHGYGTKRGTRKLLRWIGEIKPDIIHIGNLHANYINFPILFDYIVNKKIPIVFTLHDCFNFTGKCSHYTAIKCYKWQTECKHCLTFRNCIAPSLFFDRSNKLFNQKRHYYEKFDSLTVVAVSRWLAKEAEQSPMFTNAREITHIYNWVDYTKFYRASDEEIDMFYKKYNLSKKYNYLISVSQGWNCNSSRYKDAVRLAKILPNNYKLILVGNVDRGTNIEMPIIHIPHIDDAQELSAVYSMSEAYIHLSVEDTFGMVIAEAMACGTVPITFNSTACSEIPGPYGVVVPPHDVNAIVESLKHLPDLKRNKDNIIRYVKENYSYETNAMKYLQLYKEIVESRTKD